MQGNSPNPVPIGQVLPLLPCLLREDFLISYTPPPRICFAYTSKYKYVVLLLKAFRKHDNYYTHSFYCKVLYFIETPKW